MDLMDRSEGKIDPTFFSTCRLCVSKPGSYQILPQIQKQIKEFFDISVHAYDGLPQLLCEECRSVITYIHATRTTFQTKQKELISRNRVLNTSEDVEGNAKYPEDEVVNKEPLKASDIRTIPPVTLLDVTKVREKCIMGLPTAELVRAASTPPIVTTTNVELTSAEFDNECDISAAEGECIHPESPTYNNDIAAQANESVGEESDGEDTYADEPPAVEARLLERDADETQSGEETHDNRSVARRSTTPVCSSSKSPKIWRRSYVCKFCTQSFPQLGQIHLHLLVHSHLIKLQHRHDIIHCCVVMNHTDETELEPSAKILDAAIYLRKDSKVKNVFEHFYISSLYVDAEEYNESINESDKVRNLRNRRHNYYVSEYDSDSDDAPLAEKYSRIPKPSSSSSYSGETRSRSSKITPRKVGLKPVKRKPPNVVSKLKSEIMGILNRTPSSVMETQRRNTELLKLDQTVIDFLEKQDSRIHVVWQNSLKSHAAEFVVGSKELFDDQSDEFAPVPDCPSDFEDLSPTFTEKAIKKAKALEKAKAIEEQKALEEENARQEAQAFEKAKALVEKRALEEERALEKAKALEEEKARQEAQAFEKAKALVEKRALENAKALEMAQEKGKVQTEALEKAQALQKPIALSNEKAKKPLQKKKFHKPIILKKRNMVKMIRPEESKEQTRPSVIQVNNQLAHEPPMSTSSSIVAVPKTIDNVYISDNKRNDKPETSAPAPLVIDTETNRMPIILFTESLAPASASRRASAYKIRLKTYAAKRLKTYAAKRKRAPDETTNPPSQQKQFAYNPSLADLLAKPNIHSLN